MTKDEILALSGEVVAALWPDWGYPPPNLTKSEHFVAALKLSQFSIGFNGKEWWSGDGQSRGCADTPELALLLALVDYVRRGKEKR